MTSVFRMSKREYMDLYCEDPNEPAWEPKLVRPCPFPDCDGYVAQDSYLSEWCIYCERDPNDFLFDH